MYNNNPTTSGCDATQQQAQLKGLAGRAVGTTCDNSRVEPKLSEIPEALKRAFYLSDEMSAQLADLNARLRPVSQCEPPSEDTKTAEARTEVGSAIAQLNARMTLMLGAIQSMTCRLEI